MNRWILSCLAMVLLPGSLWADQTLVVRSVTAPPLVDGRAEDAAWSQAEAITTMDAVTKVPVILKAVRYEDRLFFLVQVPDAKENREHKLLLWDEKLQEYLPGPEREDAFVFKWNLEGTPIDLSLTSDTPNRADVWYWKACRTDHAGYADDKMDVYSATNLPQAKKSISKNGQLFYLVRLGDAGKAAYDGAVYDGFVQPRMPGFIFGQPEGSRADIRAKGHWQEGRWTIEFERKLQTGHSDDVQFTLQKTYGFGISINEVAGRDPDPSLENPVFGSGDVGEILTLAFK